MGWAFLISLFLPADNLILEFGAMILVEAMILTISSESIFSLFSRGVPLTGTKEFMGILSG